MHVALLRLVFQEDVADGVDDQDLAVLRHGALLRADGAAGQLGFDGRADALGLSLLDRARVLRRAVAAALLLLALHRALLLPVPLHALVVVGGRLLAGSRAIGLAGAEAGDVGEVAVVAPCHAAGVLDVALDELALALPADVQGAVVGAAADDDEQAE